MNDPYHFSPVQPDRPAQLDAGRLWAGGMATAVVAALIALAGTLLVEALFGVAVLAPKGAGSWGTTSTAAYVVMTSVMALLATALIQALVTYTPRPMRFFGWIATLVTVSASLAPFVSDAQLSAKLATAILNLILGVAIGSLVAGTARTAIRAAHT